MAKRKTWSKVNQWGKELTLLRTIIEKTELVEIRPMIMEGVGLNDKYRK